MHGGYRSAAVLRGKCICCAWPSGTHPNRTPCAAALPTMLRCAALCSTYPCLTCWYCSTSLCSKAVRYSPYRFSACAGVMGPVSTAAGAARSCVVPAYAWLVAATAGLLVFGALCWGTCGKLPGAPAGRAVAGWVPLKLPSWLPMLSWGTCGLATMLLATSLCVLGKSIPGPELSCSFELSSCCCC